MATIDVRRFADASDARQHYLAKIDAAAAEALAAIEQPRLAGVHAAKARDAERGSGLWLDAECAATGLDADSAARRILGARDQCNALALTIEHARIEAKESIRSTTDSRAMHASLSRFTAALEACDGK